MRPRTRLVGRDTEQQLLAAAIAAAETGAPTALLISGEAGVGKTRLVNEVTAAADGRGFSTLWGHCVRFGAAESAYQPIGLLLTQWFRQAGPAERERVLAGLPVATLAAIAPDLGPATEGGPGRLIPLVATVLDRIAEDAPTVLVIDDLQWTDTTSLDLLAYLLAGFGPGQRLVVLATYRDTDLDEGHRLHGWLADMRRLPMVSELHLEPLGLPETEELVAVLSGEDGTVSRAAEVFERSRGNPYLTELLVLAPDRTSLRAGSLRDELLASWHRMSGPAREVAQLLAVGGRPVDQSVLEQLGRMRGLDPAGCRVRIGEIVAAGIGTVDETGQVWFRHPLLSEVLVSTLAAGELEEVHAEYARLWQESTHSPAAARTAHLALHHDGAHHDDEAYEWSLHAAAAAAELFAWHEEFEHLHRACLLWPRVSPDRRGSDADRVGLLWRASDSAIRAGEFHVALELREDALRLIDPQAHPLEAARISIHVGTLRGLCGTSTDFAVEPELRALTECIEDLPERAIALAKLALVETDAGHPVAAARYGREAVRVARRSGSDEALAWALGYRSQLGWGRRVALEEAEEAVVHARASGDRLLLAIAAGCLYNCLVTMGYRARAADRLLEIHRELLAAGSFYESVQVLPAVPQVLVDVGRWAEARQVLREALSRRLTSARGGDLRRVAADLAARSGELEAARQHLIRARELVPHRRLVLDFYVPAESRVAIAMGDQVRALSLMVEAMPAIKARDLDSADELLVWGARAAADLAARPGEHAEAVAWLEELERLRGDTPRFAPRASDDVIHPAWERLHAAETARCRDGGARRPDLWEAAADACATAQLPWEQALADYWFAQSLLATRGSRARAASALREAARISRTLGAAPILADVEALAEQSHIPLVEPASAEMGAETPPVLACLTPREREVLRHLVAGRTYAEIARELFISEKTVSVHVSNLLRKTSTSSRIEVTELARRLAAR